MIKITDNTGGEFYMKPFIGITSTMQTDELSHSISKYNVNAIIQAGGVPVGLPNIMNEADIHQLAEKLDGLYATGGYDIDPTLFGEEPHPKLGTITPKRDHFEMILFKKMLELNKPLLAVCRGMQILNIAEGGDMYQDIYSQIDRDLLQHSQIAPLDHAAHFVDVKKDSLLHELTGKEKLKVNTRHHQANRKIPTSLQVSGTASDGIIEAVESTEHKFALGVQWHPENLLEAGDEPSKKIYEGFIAACK